MQLTQRTATLSAVALVAALSATAVPAAAHTDAAPPRTSRASTGTGGQQADGASSAPAISADGRYVAFVSSADNLVKGDRNGVADVFVKDLRTGGTERVATGPAQDPRLSADGRYVVLATKAALARDDDNGLDDIYLVDRRTHRTQRISHGHAATTPTFALNYEPTISADGRYVAYSTAAPDAAPGDTNGRDDVIVHDRRTGKDELVAYATDGTLGDSDSFLTSLSADGRYVAFTTAAQLDPSHDWTHATNVYVRDRVTGTTEQVSIPTGFVYKNSSWGPSISADARYVAFSSNVNNLVPGDTNKTGDTFVFDRRLKTTQRVSTAADGTQSDGPSAGVSLTADGSRVAFVSSADNLVPGDTNGVADVFLKDLRTGAVERISLAADGTQSDGPADAVSLGADARAAFSATATNLVPGDTNGDADIFVRRPEAKRAH
ncbi:TolB family protein [Streptomyces sp. NPDC057257]|uniref:TolB family protein n=1 Tax=Streptomyces sp. NPDC057257 TaxID=3346071 RepID=UPI003630EEC9